MVAWLRWVAWGTCSFAVVALLTQPVSVDTQLALGLSTIATMIAVWRSGHSRLARQVFVALGTFVVIRYVYWRLTSTLPPISEPINFIPGVILCAAEMYCVLILAISLFINSDPLVRKPLPRDPDEDLPTVDVFIPSYNEDESILAITIAAARSMDYPREKLTVWLLDDGGTDQKCNDDNPEKALTALHRRAALQALCSDMGAHYLTRARNQHAKAGNLNNGLENSKAELIVVFDADHAPFRSFLRETVGHFARDPKLFLVQTPHVFLNPDPIEKNLSTFAAMPSENEMFYSVTQRGLDKWDGSFFCGSAAVLRRTALIETNGFSGITITEDCETAFELHSKGWHSCYVDKPLIAGLQPETFTSFIGQRSRWLQGMFQILMLKNPTFKKGLSFPQRLSYLSSMTYWFFPVPRLIFMLSPLLYIFLDVKLFVSNVEETIAYTLLYIIVNLMLQNYLYGRVRWPWVSELYEYAQGVFLIKAMATVIRSPRKPTFNVTAKGLTLDKDHLSELAWPFFTLYALLFAGGLVAAWRYAFEPDVTNLMLVVGLWNVFNMMIAGAALGAIAERKQPDRHPRLTISRKAVLHVGAEQADVIVANVSSGGCAIRFADGIEPLKLRVGTSAISLVIEPIGPHAGDTPLPLRYIRSETQDAGQMFAFAFPELKPAEHYALADLMYGDADQLSHFLATRRGHKNVFSGSGQFLWWGLIEPFRAISYLFLSKQDARETASPLPATASTAGLRHLLTLSRGKLRASPDSAAPARRAA